MCFTCRAGRQVEGGGRAPPVRSDDCLQGYWPRKYETCSPETHSRKGAGTGWRAVSAVGACSLFEAREEVSLEAASTERDAPLSPAGVGSAGWQPLQTCKNAHSDDRSASDVDQSASGRKGRELAALCAESSQGCVKASAPAAVCGFWPLFGKGFDEGLHGRSTRRRPVRDPPTGSPRVRMLN